MIFTISRNFLEFFLNLYELISNFYHLKKLKKCKKGVFYARAHVDATWHARPRGSATWTRACACVALRCKHIFIFNIYSAL